MIQNSLIMNLAKSLIFLNQKILIAFNKLKVNYIIDEINF